MALTGNVSLRGKDSKKSIKAFPIDESGKLVTIATRSTDAKRTFFQFGGLGIEPKLIIQDPVSFLTLLQADAESLKGVKFPDLGSTSNLSPGDALYVDAPGGAIARIGGWQRKYNGFLPLALLRMHYDGEAPVPGTPLFDKAGKLVAIAHDHLTAAGTPAGYALPVETLIRVREGLENNKMVVRSWVGLLLEAENSIPVVSSVRPESPAANAGVRTGDVLLKIGGLEIDNYASAVNAFYYLVAGKETSFEVLRGTKLKTFTVKPIIQPLIQNKLNASKK